jgi:hypothetical protein
MNNARRMMIGSGMPISQRRAPFRNPFQSPASTNYTNQVSRKEFHSTDVAGNIPGETRIVQPTQRISGSLRATAGDGPLGWPTPDARDAVPPTFAEPVAAGAGFGRKLAYPAVGVA